MEFGKNGNKMTRELQKIQENTKRTMDKDFVCWLIVGSFTILCLFGVGDGSMTQRIFGILCTYESSPPEAELYMDFLILDRYQT